MEIVASDKMKEYFQMLEDEVVKLYSVANEARSKGLDPDLEPEIHLAKDVAGKVEGLMELKGISDRIRVLTLQMDRENVAFKIAQEIASGKFIGNLPDEKKADIAIRTALAILTEGVTAAPLEGIAKVKIKRNDDNSRYLAVYFAGPIRSAGGTEAALTVLISDHVRKSLNLSKYKATAKEMKRFVEEVDLYNRVMHLQSPTTPEQIEFAVKNLPVEVTGEPTNPDEVSAFRDLPRIETNCLRGGACLVLNDGIVGRAMKILKTVTAVGLKDWDWLKSVKITSTKTQSDKEKEEAKEKTQPSAGYIKDVIAGRPIFSHPSEQGGFRIRYGHARNTGLAGIGIHPATMKVVKEFLAPGTHIRTERPGKGSIVMPVDSIDGPIVLLKDGTVLRLDTYDQAIKYDKQIKEILFLGDLLVGFGEFLENNHPLIPSGFVEEWWILYFESRIKSRCDNDFDVASKLLSVPSKRLREFIDKPITTRPTQEEALSFSYELMVPLHPFYTYTWHDITFDDFFQLRAEIINYRINDKDKVLEFTTNRDAIVLLKEFKRKRLLEILGLPHKVKKGHIVIDEANLILDHCMQLKNKKIDSLAIDREAGPPFKHMVPFEIKFKIPIYSGARMGRPEKAKERKMNPPIHSLFPVEMEGGGNSRLVLEAGKKKEIEITVIQRECKSCSIITHLSSCPNCQNQTELLRSCRICGAETTESFCDSCKRPTVTYSTRLVDISKDITRVKKTLGGSIPSGTKGVKKLMNRGKIPEILEKGFLRARHGLNVYKDGTIRFDSTDIPLMHFKPKEVSATIAQLLALGYTQDIEGKPLTETDQLLELKIQDVVLNIDNGEFLIRVSKYVDDLLESVYGMPRFYNFTKITDLIGHLVIGLAPHTSSGITGRIIGFTTVKGNLAHPYWHAAKRRNCFPGSDEILVEINGQLSRISLADLYENYFTNEIKEKLVTKKDQAKSKIKTVSFNLETGQTMLTNIKDVIRTQSPDHLIQFKLKTGRKFTTTAKHPVIVHSEGKLIEKPALDVKQGDYFILPSLTVDKVDKGGIRLLDEFSKENFPINKQELMLRGIEDYTKSIVEKLGLAVTAKRIGINKKTLNNYFCKHDSIPFSVLLKLLNLHNIPIKDIPACNLGFKQDHTIIPSVIQFNDELMKLAGYFIAEGYHRKSKRSYQVDFAFSEEKILTEIKQLIHKVFSQGVKTHETEERITISCRIIYLIFKEILMLANTARTKRIPSMFLKLPKHKLSNLLAAYFSGVRGLKINGHSINCSSFSYELIKDIDTALLRFGIFSSLSQHTRDNNVEYKLQLSGQDVLEFSDKINFTSERKYELLEKEIQLLKPKEIMKFKGNKLIPIQEIKLIQSEHEYVYSLNAEKFHTVLINENIVTHQCDGDEDAVILMLEGFLDFSKQFLPITRGGSMDAPLTLGLVLNPIEVDDESHAVDCMKRYPLEFYEQSFKFIDSKKISGIIDLIANRLDTPDQFENFHCTHETTDIATGPISTNYSRLGKMAEKLEAQLAVARLIRAAKMEDVAERVINKHFFPDMIGCLRAFGSQTFRCIRCNTKYRRLPLTGKCSVCIDGGKLLLTVHKKTVTKYFETTQKLIREYNLSDYIKQRLELFDESINEYFILEENNQTSLTDFFGKPD